MTFDFHRTLFAIAQQLGKIDKARLELIAKLFGVEQQFVICCLTDLLNRKCLVPKQVEGGLQVTTPVFGGYGYLYLLYISKSLKREEIVVGKVVVKKGSAVAQSRKKQNDEKVLTPDERNLLNWFEDRLKADSFYIPPEWRNEQVPALIGMTKIAPLAEWLKCYEYTKTERFWKKVKVTTVETLKKAWNHYKATRKNEQPVATADSGGTSRKKRSRIEAEAN